jgi:hypothetical protein
LQYPAFTGPLIGVPSLAPLSGYFAGGGGGAQHGYGNPNPGQSSGGLGGGGRGSVTTDTSSTNAVQNSGGGGGGAGAKTDGGSSPLGPPYNAGTSGYGGDGIVIIRYLA